MTITFICTEPELQRLAADIAQAAQIGDVFALNGDLGAGKSTFARAFIRAIACDHEHILDVPSPTFTLVQIYDLPKPISHFDFYRIADRQEADELGLEDMIAQSIVLAEWPERVEGLLPDDTVTVSLDMVGNDANQRQITIAANGDVLARIKQSLAIRAVLQNARWGEAIREPFAADASARGYEHAQLGNDRRYIMDAPRAPDGPPVKDGKPYSQIAHLAEDVSAFIAIATALKTSGFAAPEIFGFDLDRGIVLIEDLGGQTILDDNGRPIEERYIDSARVLAHMHQVEWQDALPVTPTVDHCLPAYDIDVFTIEAELLADWYVPRQSGRALRQASRDDYRRILSDLHAQLSSKQTLILRDHHSPNIIWRDKPDLRDRVGLIDFQDALLGSAAYDVMSLAEDARVDVPSDLRSALFDAYCSEAVKLDRTFDRESFERDAAIVAAQRACKILGIFVRLDERDGKPAYLTHLPRVQDALNRALIHPALRELKSWLEANDVLQGSND